MTAAATLLDTLTRRGIQLELAGDAVLIRPASKLTDADREAIRAHKAEVLRLLAGRCQHVAHDADLADWYRENPHLTCARCFLAGRPIGKCLQ